MFKFIVNNGANIGTFKTQAEGNAWVDSNFGPETPRVIEDLSLEIESQNSLKFLNDTDYKVIRHRDQIDAEISTTLTDEEYQQLLIDRQNARLKVL